MVVTSDGITADLAARGQRLPRAKSTLAIVVCTGTSDLGLFQRLYTSLIHSDCPKEAPLILMSAAYFLDRARLDGTKIAADLAEFVLLADTDIIVPNHWWNEVASIFSDPKVGLVSLHIAQPTPELAGVFDGFVVFRSKYLQETQLYPLVNLEFWARKLPNGWIHKAADAAIIHQKDEVKVVGVAGA